MAPLPSRWLPLLALLLGCSAAALGKRNDPPGVAIVSPGSGDVLFEGAPVELWVDVEDEAAIEELDYYWRVNPGGLLLGTLSFQGSQAIYRVEDGLPAGEVELSVEVIDPDAASGEDTLTVSVLPNGTPLAAWQQPAEGAVVAAGESLSFELQASDPDEDPEDLQLSWTGLPEEVTPPAQLEPDGELKFTWSDPQVGDYTLEVEVTDAAGATAEALLSFVVVEPDADGDGFTTALERWTNPPWMARPTGLTSMAMASAIPPRPPRPAACPLNLYRMIRTVMTPSPPPTPAPWSGATRPTTTATARWTRPRRRTPPPSTATPTPTATASTATR